MNLDVTPVIELPEFLIESALSSDFLIISISVFICFLIFYLFFYKRIKIFFSLYRIRLQFKNKQLDLRLAAYELTTTNKNILTAESFNLSKNEHEALQQLKYTKDSDNKQLQLDSLIKRMMKFSLLGRY